MGPRRRSILRRCSALFGTVLAGCTIAPDSGSSTRRQSTAPTGSSPSPSPSSSPSPSPSPSPSSPSPSCSRPTPTPVPDLSVVNRGEAPVSVTVTVSVPRDGSASGSELRYRETVEVEPDEHVDRDDVFTTTETVRVAAVVDGGATSERLLDVEPDDRRSIVTVTVRSRDDVEVDRLHIVPEPTPTFCPSS